MSSKLKVATIVGTRPEIIRLSSCILANERYFDHIFIHTGQNWDERLYTVFLKELGLPEPDYYLDAVGGNLGETMGNIIAKAYTLLCELMPDALLVLGDTNSALSAIAAKRLKIPIFHMEAGNRCFDMNVPEEINRRIIDHVSDVNLPYTEHARRYLLAEGLPAEMTFVTGSPMREVLEKHMSHIDASDVLARLGLSSGRYFIVSAHREENIDSEEHFTGLMTALNGVAERYGLPVVYSVHPRSKKQIEQRGFKFNSLVRAMSPFGFFDYNKLQREAFCVLSDSGTLAEESSILDFPAVLLRTSTERPEAMDAGNMVIGEIGTREILQAVELCRSRREDAFVPAPVKDYTDAGVSMKVAGIIQSYTGIVNRKVWGK
ncbi:MAG TPA: UDP-N-acetylglucosamine 2-epimerase (non-hydrolyzing) [Ruminococcaceae bacterium]|nr:UDP-N-acetylglucosamine 2-epimerase (non-hydrolyzing) [Oscillospiraceae bacterium]